MPDPTTHRRELPDARTTVATITTLGHRPATVAVRRRAVLEVRPIPRAEPPAVSWEVAERRYRRQRALLYALIVVVVITGLATLGYVAAVEAVLGPRTAMGTGVVALMLAVLWFLRRSRDRCPGVVVHCPPKRHRH